jgi:hypothetical protein
VRVLVNLFMAASSTLFVAMDTGAHVPLDVTHRIHVHVVRSGIRMALTPDGQPALLFQRHVLFGSSPQWMLITEARHIPLVWGALRLCSSTSLLAMLVV